MSAAAQKLYLTQPAVSQQIRVLEEQLEVKLIVRDSRPSVPTVQGQLLYDYAKKILNLTQQAEVALNTISRQIEGQYTIGTVNSLGLHFLSPMTGLLLKYNPKVSLKFVYSPYEDILKQFEDGTLDAVILADISKEVGEKKEKSFQGLEKHLLSQDEMLLVSSSKIPGVPSLIDVKDINRFPIVFFNQMYNSFQKSSGQIFAKEGIDIYPSFECNNVGTAKRIIEYGVGWGFLPFHSIYKQLRSQRMKQTRVNGLQFDVGIYLYSYKSKRAKQLASFLYHSLKQSSRY